MKNNPVINELKNRMDINFEWLVNLIESPAFFGGNYQPISYEEVIHDKNLALEIATNESIEKPYSCWNVITYKHSLLGEATTEEDLSEQLSNEERFRLLNIFQSRYYEELYSLIETKLKNNNNLNIFSDLVSQDFYNFLLERSYLLKPIPFIEREIAIYQNGGFPCGWKGNYPEGDFVVFSPIA